MQNGAVMKQFQEGLGKKLIQPCDSSYSESLKVYNQLIGLHTTIITKNS